MTKVNFEEEALQYLDSIGDHIREVEEEGEDTFYDPLEIVRKQCTQVVLTLGGPTVYINIIHEEDHISEVIFVYYWGWSGESFVTNVNKHHPIYEFAQKCIW